MRSLQLNARLYDHLCLRLPAIGWGRSRTGGVVFGGLYAAKKLTDDAVLDAVHNLKYRLPVK